MAVHALVVEGGAMRGIFSTGVLDAFLEEDYNPFDLFLGVSAEATNIASFLAKMYQRNYKVYTDYSLRSDFINWRKFLMGGHLVDLDWLWDISIKEIRLDLEELFNPEKDYYIGVTEVKTGEIVNIKPKKENLEILLKASSAIPLFYRKLVSIDNKEFVDGGLADPIPVIEAYNRSASDIVVIRSRPSSYKMQPSLGSFISKLYLKKYPKLAKAVLNRPKVYQKAIEFIRNPPGDVSIIEISPPESFQTKRLTKDIDILKKDYNHGYKMGIELINKLKER